MADYSIGARAMNDYHPERGAALIYVTLMFAAASVIAVGLAAGERMDVLRTARFVDIEQARQYALGAEIHARQLLLADLKQRTDLDYPGEAWGKAQPVFTIENGSIALRIEDLRGRFNINSVLNGNPVAQGRFIRLCMELGIEEKVARDVLTHLTPNQPPPVKITTDVTAANVTPIPPGFVFADPSELVDAGMPMPAYRALEPYLAALPDATMDINANTASDLLLRAALPDATQAASIRSIVSRVGYIVQEQFGLVHTNDPTLRTKSEFFRVHAVVRLRGQYVYLTSTLFRRPNGGISTIARTWGN